MAGQPSSTIQSVERAIAILKSFGRQRPERGVTELSRELGVHKSTVSRLMMTLERGGLLSRNPETERYRLGVELISLAAQVVNYMDVREVARPVLRKLADTCQETVNLVVLEGGQVINLEQFVPPARRIKNIGQVGRHMCPHCTAAGKVLLAHLPGKDLDQILEEPMERFTPHTVTDPHKLRRELIQIRQRGYAVAQEELEEGLNAIAAPVYDHTGQVNTAITVAGPAYRVMVDLFPKLTAQLKDAAMSISQQLGYPHV